MSSLKNLSCHLVFSRVLLSISSKNTVAQIPLAQIPPPREPVRSWQDHPPRISRCPPPQQPPLDPSSPLSSRDCTFRAPIPLPHPTTSSQLCLDPRPPDEVPPDKEELRMVFPRDHLPQRYSLREPPDKDPQFSDSHRAASPQNHKTLPDTPKGACGQLHQWEMSA